MCIRDRPTTDQRKILMAEYCTQVVANTPYFKDGFSYQTGVGGASIASTISLSKIMEEKNIHMGLGVGGLTKPMCELLDRGLARKLVDTQDFDLDAVNNCLLYTSDAADEEDSVDLGGRRHT